jgi:hypothetical protein
MLKSWMKKWFKKERKRNLLPGIGGWLMPIILAKQRSGGSRFSSSQDPISKIPSAK